MSQLSWLTVVLSGLSEWASFFVNDTFKYLYECLYLDTMFLIYK